MNCEEETIFQVLYENWCELGLWLNLDQDLKIWLGIQNFHFSFIKNLRSEQNRRYKHFRFKQTSNNCMARRFVKLCGALNVLGQKLEAQGGHTRLQLCKRSQTTFSCLQVQTFKLFIICSIFLVQTSKQHQYLQGFSKKFPIMNSNGLSFGLSRWNGLNHSDQYDLDHCSYFLLWACKLAPEAPIQSIWMLSI